MSKSPPNLPAVGDYAKLRGRPLIGVVKEIYDNLWTRVWWGEDESQQGPKFCHLHELERFKQ